MKVYTTQPGVQLYTGNFLQDCPAPGKGGMPMQKYGGFAPGDPALPCSPPTRSSLHRPAGRESIPRQHHPAVLHRQTVGTVMQFFLHFKA